MVKIEGLTEREIALRTKTSKLTEITKQVLGITGALRFNLSSVGNIHIKHHSTQALGYPIVVSPDLNRISVESKTYFEEAMKLARAYEEAFSGEAFTIKKTYER